MNITEFLTARYDEIEAREGGKWRPRAGVEQPYEYTTEGVRVSFSLDLNGRRTYRLSLEEFLASFMEPAPDPAVLADLAAKRTILSLHESWPVLTETMPKFEIAGGIAGHSFRASQQIEWLTTQEYRAKFGDEPPTAPVLAALAGVYSDHPDYDPTWSTS